MAYSTNSTIRNHVRMIQKAKKELSQKFSGKIIENKPIPDLLLIDFEKKKVYGIEVSNQSQRWKRMKYIHSDFSGIVFIKFSRKCSWKQGKINLIEL